MRIALNASILRASRTGIGQYVAGLVTALQAHEDIELSLFLGWGWSTHLPATQMSAPGMHGVRDGAAWLRRFPGAYRVRRAVQQHAFHGGMRRTRFDLYHEPSLWPYETETDVRMVMTLHDLTHVHYPETQPAARLREIERHVHRGVARAERILVDSDYIGREVQTHFGLPAEKIVVAPLGCGVEFHPRTDDELRAGFETLKPRAYLLCVGTLEPRKNLSLALRAHARLPLALRERYPLLVVGMMGWNTGRFSEELRAALATGHVRLAGYLSQESLAVVVAGARALIYPSLYEGFGLPVVEAMASGTPVIVSNRASLPEVAGDAGLMVDAEDEDRLSLAMQTLIEDETVWQACRQAGLQQAAQFTWSRCAEITVQTYRVSCGLGPTVRR